LPITPLADFNPGSITRTLVQHYFFAALILAQRALCAAGMRFRPAGDIVRFGWAAPLTLTLEARFAHRAF